MAAFKRQQVGLLRQVVDHFDDLADVVRALPEHIDDFARRANGGVDLVQAVGGLFHGGDAAVNFFARAVGDIEQNLGGIGHALDRGHHLIDGSRSLADARGLGLRALHHVLHVDAHLVHGAGDFVDGRRGLQADLGGFVGGAGHLAGSAGHLRSGIAHVAHQVAQALSTMRTKALPSVSFLERGCDLDREIAAGDGFGDCRHLLQVGDHVVEGSRQFADFVLALDVNFVIEIAGIADLLGHVDQAGQRLGDGFSGADRR